jgi:hypothetical protein
MAEVAGSAARRARSRWQRALGLLRERRDKRQRRTAKEKKAALLDELTFVLEAIGSERLAFLLKSHDREDAKVLGAEAT